MIAVVEALIQSALLSASLSAGLGNSVVAFPGSLAGPIEHRTITAANQGWVTIAHAPAFATSVSRRPASTISHSNVPQRIAMALFHPGSGNNDVEVFDGSFNLQYVIANGGEDPVGVWYDNKGNLYVATGNAQVDEYAPGATSPSFTYPTHGDATAVATDKSDNVYVLTGGGGVGTGGVTEKFPQGSATDSSTCSWGYSITPWLYAGGIALDPAGNVFEDVEEISSGKHSLLVVEYPKHLKSCASTVLPVQLGTQNFGAQLQVDKKRNLLVCNGPALDVVAPPYNAISSTISVPDCSDVALNKVDTTIYAVDDIVNGNGGVAVDDYPSGTNLMTINLGNSVFPISIAAYPTSR